MSSQHFFVIAFFIIVLIHVPGGMVLGEGPLLTASALHFGISHPPGYPLYQHFSRTFQLIPLGNLAFRVHLLSLVCGCLVLALLFEINRHLFQSKGFAAVLLLAINVTFVDSCRKAEVYTLAVLMALLVIWLPAKPTSGTDCRNFYLAAFITGLMCTHHMTAFLVLPTILWLIISRRIRLRSTTIFISVMWGIAGLSVLLYLPLRASAFPAINWGQPDNWKRFITLISAAEEARGSIAMSFLLGWFHPMVVAMRQLSDHLNNLALLIGAMGGWLLLRRRDKRMAIFSALFIVPFIFGVIVYHSNESAYFFLPAMAMVVSLIDYLFFRVFSFRASKSPLIKRAVSYVFLPLAVCILVFFPLWKTLSSSQYPLQWSESTPDLEITSRIMLSSCAPRSYLFVNHSSLYFILLYAQTVEHIGEQQIPLFTHLLSFPWYFNLYFPDPLPLKDQDSLETLANDSEQWNAAITTALMRQGIRRNGAYGIALIPPQQFQKWALSQRIVACPRGLVTRYVTREYCGNYENPAYHWFSYFTLHQPLEPLNYDLLSYIHHIRAQQWRALEKKLLSEEEERLSYTLKARLTQ